MPFYRTIEPADPLPDASSAPLSAPVVERFAPSVDTAGPWSPDSQHGGPPCALLTRAVERLPAAGGYVAGRVTVEIWGGVPVHPEDGLEVRARVVRPGRSVQLATAELVDPARGRTLATASAWLFPAAADGPAPAQGARPHGPGDGVARARPEGWAGGYLDAVEWRWIEGGLADAGRGVVWMRPPALVEGEELTPAQRVLACVDSASGIGAALPVSDWRFLNTELSVHLLRPMVGDWLCVEAETTLGPGSVGIATSAAYDELGLVARSSQALLVVPVG